MHSLAVQRLALSLVADLVRQHEIRFPTPLLARFQIRRMERKNKCHAGTYLGPGESAPTWRPRQLADQKSNPWTFGPAELRPATDL